MDCRRQTGEVTNSIQRTDRTVSSCRFSQCVEIDSTSRETECDDAADPASSQQLTFAGLPTSSHAVESRAAREPCPCRRHARPVGGARTCPAPVNQAASSLPIGRRRAADRVRTPATIKRPLRRPAWLIWTSNVTGGNSEESLTFDEWIQNCYDRNTPGEDEDGSRDEMRTVARLDYCFPFIVLLLTSLLQLA